MCNLTFSKSNLDSCNVGSGGKGTSLRKCEETRATIPILQDSSPSTHGDALQQAISSHKDLLLRLPRLEAKSMQGILTRKSCWFTDNNCACNYKYGKRKTDNYDPVPFPDWMKELSREIEVGL